MTNGIITSVSEKELVVLRSLEHMGEGSVLDISKNTGIKRTTIYNFINKLVLRGLVEVVLRNNYHRYKLSSKCPSVFSNVTKNEKTSKSDNFQLFTTRYAIRRAINDTLKTKSKKVDWIVGSPDTTDYLGAKFIEKYIEKASELGVEIRTLRSPKTIPAHKYGSDEAVKSFGRNLRRAQSNLPFKTTITISDDTLTFISSNKGGVGYSIRDQEIADSFRFIYNGLWKYAKVIGEEKYY